MPSTASILRVGLACFFASLVPHILFAELSSSAFGLVGVKIVLPI